MPRRVEVSVRIASGAGEVAKATADLFAKSAAEAVKARGHARIAISGGSTPKAVFALLATEPYLSEVPWAQVQLFWVDERCVGPEDKDSNYGMTKAALLDKVLALPDANVHRMEGELDPELGASRYEAEIRNTFKLEGAETPTFDLILLGMGDDGHTASLFPHTAGLDEMARIVIANHVPQKETWRLTLTWPVITQGREVAFLIEGAAKAEILHAVMQGKYDPEMYPSQLIRPANGRLMLMLDTASASKLELPAAVDGVTTLELS
jgi:6-phosphogluconolactonase